MRNCSEWTKIYSKFEVNTIIIITIIWLISIFILLHWSELRDVLGQFQFYKMTSTNSSSIIYKHAFFSSFFVSWICQIWFSVSSINFPNKTNFLFVLFMYFKEKETSQFIDRKIKFQAENLFIIYTTSSNTMYFEKIKIITYK